MAAITILGITVLLIFAIAPWAVIAIPTIKAARKSGLAATAKPLLLAGLIVGVLGPTAGLILGFVTLVAGHPVIGVTALWLTASSITAGILALTSGAVIKLAHL